MTRGPAQRHSAPTPLLQPPRRPRAPPDVIRIEPRTEQLLLELEAAACRADASTAAAAAAGRSGDRTVLATFAGLSPPASEPIGQSHSVFSAAEVPSASLLMTCASALCGLVPNDDVDCILAWAAKLALRSAAAFEAAQKPVDVFGVHRLVLGCVVIALKVMADSPPTIATIAREAGIAAADLSRAESLLCCTLDWRLQPVSLLDVDSRDGTTRPA